MWRQKNNVLCIRSVHYQRHEGVQYQQQVLFTWCPHLDCIRKHVHALQHQRSPLNTELEILARCQPSYRGGSWSCGGRAASSQRASSSKVVHFCVRFTWTFSKRVASDVRQWLRSAVVLCRIGEVQYVVYFCCRGGAMLLISSTNAMNTNLIVSLKVL